MTHVVTDDTRRLVETSSGMGLAHETICLLIGVTPKTLRKRYRKEIDQGMAKAHFNVAKTTYEKAIAGDKTMLIWYEKTRMGMRETLQVATPPGEALVSATGEPELIGTYYRRLQAAGLAAHGRAAGADPGADPPVGAGGQGPDGPLGDPEADQG